MDERPQEAPGRGPGGATEPEALAGRPPAGPPLTASSGDEPAQATSAEPAPDTGAAPPLDLRFWLLVVAAAGVASLALAQVELTLLIVLAGVYAVAHAADLRPERDAVYRAVVWVVPAGALLVFSSLALALLQSELPGLARGAGLAAAALGAVAALAVAPRPVADALARFLFRAPRTSHVTRLTARLALIGLALSPPAHLAFPIAADQLARSGGSLVGAGSLWANLIGLSLLALGGVGFRVRRTARLAAERLGLAPLRPSHFPVVLLGMAGLFLANVGAEALQKAWFPSLWASDQRVNEMIAGSLSRADALLLGLSAGVGEELVLRGALQPRLGVAPTAALFAVLHVQYSWFGMAIIAVLGLFLGAIRRWTSTTVAIAVHVFYDVAAVLALKS
jgi:hypothetical protein